MQLHDDRSPLAPAPAVPAEHPPAVVAAAAAVVPVAPAVARALHLPAAATCRAIRLVRLLHERRSQNKEDTCELQLAVRSRRSKTNPSALRII